MKKKTLFVVDWDLSKIKSNVREYEKKYNICFFSCYKDIMRFSGVYGRYYGYFKAVFYILKYKKKYDKVIVWQQMIGYLLLLVCPEFIRLPKIIISTVLFTYDNTEFSFVRRFLLRNALKRASALVYFSKDLSNEMRKKCSGNSDKIYYMIMPLIENSTCAEDDIECKKLERKYDVFSGGRSDRDFDVIVKAFNGTCVKVCLVVEDKKRILKEKISSNIVVYENIAKSEFLRKMKESDVVIVTTKTKKSPCGQLLVVDAFNIGIPVIVSRNSGMKHYVENYYNGICVDIGDWKGLKNAYFEINGNSDLRNKFVFRSKKLLRNMSFDSYLDNITRI